jgi:3-oxo-5-alpha-steroid 4-dehydrogenase 3
VDLGGLLFPWFRENIMTYGSRQRGASFKSNQRSGCRHILSFIASIQVPHSWFTYYYVFSVASSAFWGFQIYMQGAVLRFLATYSSKNGSKAMSTQQAILIWFLMAVQGLRRLYESLVFTKPSQATMWIGLWIMYVLFSQIVPSTLHEWNG